MGDINKLIIGKSAAAKELKRLIQLVAPSSATVLVQGETGTGKELVARAIHDESKRRGNLIAVNCAAIPSELLESELFGHEKGAFTGAVNSRAGRIEQANDGTLFLGINEGDKRSFVIMPPTAIFSVLTLTIKVITQRHGINTSSTLDMLRIIPSASS